MPLFPHHTPFMLYFHCLVGKTTWWGDEWRPSALSPWHGGLVCGTQLRSAPIDSRILPFKGELNTHKTGKGVSVLRDTEPAGEERGKAGRGLEGGE